MAAVETVAPLAKPGSGALARGQWYQLLAQVFSFPEHGFFREVTAGRWAAGAADIAAALPYRIRLPAALLRPPTVDYDSFQAEYIRLFEVGPGGGPPCPLHSGHYGRDRLRVMEELVRFFNFFGLRAASGRLPDHITVQLEFMQYLALQEAEAEGGEAESYRLAQRDFLERHLLTWLPRLEAGLRRHKPLPFYQSLVALTKRSLERDLGHARRLLRES